MKLNPLAPKYYFIQHFVKFFLGLWIFLPIPMFGIMILFELFKRRVDTKFEAIVLAVILFGLLSIIAACLLSLVTKEFYKRVHFKILKDRAEYYRDFVALQIKDLKYKNVKEISLTQGPLQKLFGTGTVLLQSHASPQTSKGGSSGLKIYDVENPRDIYDFLKKEIDKNEVK